MLHGIEVTGGTADIFKCFDQLPRPLLDALLKLGGMPPAVLRAYNSFHDNLTVYNALAGGYGKPYGKRMSIPQGCPLSMMLVAF